MKGRPRKENPRHRNPSVKATEILPAAGRPDPPPDWPLTPKATKAESEVWAAEWRLPQAIMWERQGLVRLVARYVRQLLQVEGKNPSTRLAAEVRQLEDRLGKNSQAMARFGWLIETPESKEPPAAEEVTDINAYRERIS